MGEYIICSAIWYKTEEKNTHQPKNIEFGYVICGRRHHNCVQTHFILTGKPTRKSTSVQGFLTSKDRFLDRNEAGLVAYNAGQTKKLEQPLISEDIY